MTCGGGHREEEHAGARVVKLFSIVALDALNGAAELGGHVGEKVSQSSKSLGFEGKWENPQIM